MGCTYSEGEATSERAMGDKWEYGVAFRRLLMEQVSDDKDWYGTSMTQ